MAIRKTTTLGGGCVARNNLRSDLMTKLPDEVLTARIAPALKKQLKGVASKEHRTLSNLVEVLLTTAIARYLGDQKDGAQ